MEEEGNKASLFLDILNLLGKDFILNEIKFSQLAALVDGYFLQRVVFNKGKTMLLGFLYSSNMPWILTEIPAKGKHRTLNLLYRILMECRKN